MDGCLFHVASCCWFLHNEREDKDEDVKRHCCWEICSKTNKVNLPVAHDDKKYKYKSMTVKSDLKDIKWEKNDENYKVYMHLKKCTCFSLTDKQSNKFCISPKCCMKIYQTTSSLLLYPVQCIYNYLIFYYDSLHIS